MFFVTPKDLRRMAGMLLVRVRELKLSQLDDPRKSQGRRWKLSALLSCVLIGLLAGKQNLAETEKLSASMSRPLRRKLGIRRRIPDTTLRNLLCRLHPDTLRSALHRLVKAAWRRKSLLPHNLPFGVVSMDGKATPLRFWDHVFAQLHANEKTHKAYGLLRTVTSCLVSAKTRPCIDVSPIPARTNEMGHFQAAFRQLLDSMGNLFSVVLYDAGACSRGNAQAVVDAKKHYIFRINDKRRQIQQVAVMMLGKRSVPCAQTEDILNNNKTIIRKVFLEQITPHKKDPIFWPHIRTIIRVSSVTIEHGVAQPGEERYYVSSLPPCRLAPKQWLLIIRAHWGVENNCHHTFDAIFSEDEHPWIQTVPKGALAVVILRRIACTILAIHRGVTLRSEEHRTMPYKDLLDWVLHTVLAATQKDVSQLRQRKLRPAAI